MTNRLPSVSIVTPAFNAAKTIEETISSVRAQGADLFEYIVVDANSTDGTSEILSSNSDIVTHHIRENDKGLYDGMNKGIKRATGEIVGIINADDFLMPGALFAVRSFFCENDVDFLVSDVATISEVGERIGVLKAETAWLSGKKSIIGRDWRINMVFPHPGIFVRRTVYDEIGLFDLSYKLCADHEFVARLLHNKLTGGYLAGKVLASFRLGGRSSSNLERCIREDEAIAIKYGVHPLFAKAIRKRKVAWIKANSTAQG